MWEPVSAAAEEDADTRSAAEAAAADDDDLFDDELFPDEPSDAAAQTGGPDDDAAAAAAPVDEEASSGTDTAAVTGDPDAEVIMVTANKREESIQAVAISMAALNADFVEKVGLTDFKDIQKFVPNLLIASGTDTRSTSIRIRGIGSVGTNAGIDPSVGLFIDGIYQGRAGMSMSDLIDIEAVEVLRGPQGSLYGKNTAAGLISVRTRRPEYEPTLMLEYVAGKYDALATRGSLNIPIVDDRIATRLSAYRSVNDGYDTNLFDHSGVNDENKWGFRNKWLFDIDDEMSLLVSGDYSKQNSKCCVPDIITYTGDSLLWRGTNPATNPNLNPNWTKLDGFFNPDGPDVDGNLVDPAKPRLRNFSFFDEQVDVDRKPRNIVEIWGLQSDYDVEIDEWAINWLTSYRTYQTDSQFDGDFSQYNAVVADTREDLEQVSTELRLQSPLGEYLDFTTGFYFFFLNHQTIGHIGFDQDFADIFIGPLYEPMINNDISRHKTFSYAGYGQINVNFSDTVKLTGGVRVSHEKKTLVGKQLSTSSLPAPPVAGPDIFRDERRKVTNVSGTAKLSYFPFDDVMLYASFASGFKSGGFNQLRTAQTVSPEFDDETAFSYEAGARSTWLDGMVTLNLTGFFTDYEDFQAQSFTGTSITIRNAGSFYSYGLESDLIIAPIENLVVRTSLGFNITEYQEFPQAENTVQNIVDLGASVGFAPFTLSLLVDNNSPLVAGITTTAQDLTGKRLDNAPRWSISSSVDYEHPIPDLPLFWTFHADYSFRSTIFLNQDLDPMLKEDPLHLLALRTGVRTDDERWALLFWISNMLDEEYMLAGFDVPVLGGFAGLRGPKRTYGASLVARF